MKPLPVEKQVHFMKGPDKLPMWPVAVYIIWILIVVATGITMAGMTIAWEFLQ